MSDVFVLDAVRTPFGRYGGALAGVRPDDLAAHVLSALARRGDLDPATVDEVILGDANGAGEDNRNVARMATLLAGWPTSVPGSTVNRLCGSGLDAVMQASRAIAVGDASVVVAGGVESMSRAPWVLPKPGKAFPNGHETLFSSTLGWRMVNPAMPSHWTVSLGESTELLAERYGIGRQEQDEFALRSHHNAAKAWEAGFYDGHVVEVEGTGLTRDEGIRADSTMDKLAKLKPAFRPRGTVTAGNSSPLNDGASAVLLGDKTGAEKLGATPLARVAGRGAAGVDPDVFGVGPVRAAEIALRRAGIGWEDLAAVELNEAFAAQSLACLADWPKLDPEIVNVNGGAIAIGHPLGASGGRVLGALAHELRRRGGGWGLAAICIGVGQGLAVVLEA
ncbi:beta-ketoadipyl CoA thiolase [Prauserella marina]|uniref:Probable acetyl-CoA acetyltransferase n=1 Tax=Prauserella marina TaxID=530584 RepID=A0A222VMG1_9PSEU|nr:thiolase family protein [Prauserella marina]ASR35119.1 beta-ketoadipyl CoA thiolase [Prauserella marina]PWV85126.1 acetyl-CoA acetyltransferase family protein [Prauserella marina]SDC04176.1 acetyl-CoA acetyltransferases [Prauserella marina]